MLCVLLQCPSSFTGWAASADCLLRAGMASSRLPRRAARPSGRSLTAGTVMATSRRFKAVRQHGALLHHFGLTAAGAALAPMREGPARWWIAPGPRLQSLSGALARAGALRFKPQRAAAAKEQFVEDHTHRRVKEAAVAFKGREGAARGEGELPGKRLRLGGHLGDFKRAWFGGRASHRQSQAEERERAYVQRKLPLRVHAPATGRPVQHRGDAGEGLDLRDFHPQ